MAEAGAFDTWLRQVSLHLSTVDNGPRGQGPHETSTYWATIPAGLLYEWLQAVVLLMQCYFAAQGHMRGLTGDHQMGAATSDDMHINPKARPPVPVTPSPKATPKQRASPQMASRQRAAPTTSSSSTQPPPLGDKVNPKVGQEKIGLILHITWIFLNNRD